MEEDWNTDWWKKGKCSLKMRERTAVDVPITDCLKADIIKVTITNNNHK